jgi:hypothetical protein
VDEFCNRQLLTTGLTCSILISSYPETCNIRLFWGTSEDCIFLDVRLTKVLNEMRYKWKDKYNFRAQTIPFEFVIKEQKLYIFLIWNVFQELGKVQTVWTFFLLFLNFFYLIFPELSLWCSFVSWISVIRTLLSGLDKTEAASHRSHSVEAGIPSQATWCGLYGGQTDIVQSFLLFPLSVSFHPFSVHIFSLSSTNQLQT